MIPMVWHNRMETCDFLPALMLSRQATRAAAVLGGMRGCVMVPSNDTDSNALLKLLHLDADSKATNWTDDTPLHCLFVQRY